MRSTILMKALYSFIHSKTLVFVHENISSLQVLKIIFLDFFKIFCKKNIFFNVNVYVCVFI